MNGTIRLECPHCNRVLTIRQEPKKGARILCAHCRQVFDFTHPQEKPVVLEAATETQESPVIPWYRDRILQTGIGVSALILFQRPATELESRPFRV